MGLVVGTVAGQGAWAALARSIGAAGDPSWPASSFLVVPGALVVALAIALAPARTARRVHPAPALRGE